MEMDIDLEDIAALVIKRLNGGLTAQEEATLQAWISASPVHRQAIELFMDEASLQEGLAKIHLVKERVWLNLESIIHKPRVVPMWKKIVAAASVLLVISLGAYLIISSNDKSQKSTIAKATDVIAPQTNRAMITLADGRIVYQVGASVRLSPEFLSRRKSVTCAIK